MQVHLTALKPSNKRADQFKWNNGRILGRIEEEKRNPTAKEIIRDTTIFFSFLLAMMWAGRGENLGVNVQVPGQRMGGACCVFLCLPETKGYQ